MAARAPYPLNVLIFPLRVRTNTGSFVSVLSSDRCIHHFKSGCKSAGTRGIGEPTPLTGGPGPLINRTLTTLAELGSCRWRISKRMRKLVVKAVGALIFCTLAPLDWITPIERAEAAELLTGGMLRQNIPGAKIQLDTPLGSVIPVSYGADGTLEGRAGAVAFFLGSQKDHGKWWIEGSKLCHRWNTWFNSRVSCVRVYRETDNRISWIDQDGDRGTGTIVALSPVVPAASVAQAHAGGQDAAVQPQRPLSAPKPAKAQTFAANVAAKPLKKAPAKPRLAAPPAPIKKPAAERPPEMQLAKASQLMHVAAAPSPAKAVKPAALSRTYRVVNVPFDDVLNIRSEPRAYARIVSTIPPRARGISKTGPCEGEWCPIRHGDSMGWVHRYFIVADHGGRARAYAKSSPNPITYRVVRVAASDALNLRRKPHSEAAIVGTIPPSGNRIRLTGYCVGEWCPILHGRKAGWANRHFLALEF